MSSFLANSSPSLANTFLAGVTAAIPALSEVSSLAQGGQSFQTRPVTNTRLALYTLSIRDSNGIPYSTYTFPLSPASLQKKYTAMSNIFDTAGPASTQGVQRVVDSYGNSPITYIIEGTTGWKFHATDGFGQSGIDSIINLQTMLAQYATLNQQQAQTQQPLYTLEFYDYFTGDFWQVEPIGPQEIRQARERPLVINYSFQLAGISNLSSPITQLINSLTTVLSNPAPVALGIVGGIVGQVLNNYTSQVANSLISQVSDSIDDVSSFAGDIGF